MAILFIRNLYIDFYPSIVYDITGRLGGHQMREIDMYEDELIDMDTLDSSTGSDIYSDDWRQRRVDDDDMDADVDAIMRGWGSA